MRTGGVEGGPKRDGRRTLANGWESRLWRLEDKHLREGSSVRQLERPRPLRIRHRRRRRYMSVASASSSLYNHKTREYREIKDIVNYAAEIFCSCVKYYL